MRTIKDQRAAAFLFNMVGN